MIRYIVNRGHTTELNYVEAVGLSSDQKPNTGLITGSRFKEIDTGRQFVFNEESGEWMEVQESSGEAGG